MRGKRALNSLSQNLTVLTAPSGGANPLSLLPMVAARFPEGGAFSAPPASILALSVTCGDSSPKGRALGIEGKLSGKLQSLRFRQWLSLWESWQIRRI